MDVLDPFDEMERLELLGGVPLFAGLEVEDLAHIADVTSIRSHGPGDLVYVQGDPGGEMLVVVEGTGEVVHRGVSGSRRLAMLAPGSVVGELAVLRASVRAADVVAGPKGLVGLVIDAGTLDHILQERPGIALAMLSALADKLAAASVA